MPRNEFKAGDYQNCIHCEADVVMDQQGVWVHRMTWEPACVAGKAVFATPKLEASSQEVAPVEEDPHQWPDTTLAELRKGSGLTTTAAHIDKITGRSEDTGEGSKD